MALTKEGYIKRSPQELATLMLREFIKDYPQYEALPADLLSNLRDTAVLALSQYEECTAIFMNGYKWDGVNGWIFEQSAESLNLKRNEEYQSQVALTFKGKKGTIIPKGTIVTTEHDTSIRFYTETESLIDSTGTKNVICVSDYDGIVNRGDLTKIITGLDDVEVTNLNTSLNKIPKETGEQLKRRFQELLRSPRVGTLDCAYSLLKSIEGVDPKCVKINQKEIRTKGEANEVLLQRGIEVVVGGGDDLEIAYALFKAFCNPKTLVSDPSDGNLDRKIQVDLNYVGSVIPIVFTRPTALRISITANVDLQGMTLPSVTATNICREAVINYVNSYTLGTPFNCKSLDKIIIDTLMKGLGLETFVVAKMTYEIIDKSVNGGNTYVIPNRQGNEYFSQQKSDTYLVLEDFSINIM